MDDEFAIVKNGEQNTSLKHLNSMFPDSIALTTEKELEGQASFLVVLVMRRDSRLTTKIYRKPIHSDRYLNFYFNNPSTVKIGIISGMVDRASRFRGEEFLAEELADMHKTTLRNYLPCKFYHSECEEKIKEMEKRGGLPEGGLG